MKIGISVLAAHPRLWLDLAVAADELGYESIWVSDHLALPVDRASHNPGSDNPDSTESTITRDGPRGDTFPLFDVPAMLSAMGARTSTIRLGTYVYLLGLRHPLVAARGFQTVDVISGGRVELGVGAGWLESEWRAAGMDWASRGRALDEAIDVCRRLWTEPTVEHRGETWQFEPVWFHPKPVQPGGPPILVGGESGPAMRRAVRLGDGWIAMEHTPASLAPKIEALRELAAAHGRDPDELPVTTVGTLASPDDVSAWAAIGVDRLIVTPWTRSRDAIDGITRLAAELGLKSS